MNDSSDTLPGRRRKAAGKTPPVAPMPDRGLRAILGPVLLPDVEEGTSSPDEGGVSESAGGKPKTRQRPASKRRTRASQTASAAEAAHEPVKSPATPRKRNGRVARQDAEQEGSKPVIVIRDGEVHDGESSGTVESGHSQSPHYDAVRSEGMGSRVVASEAIGVSSEPIPSAPIVSGPAFCEVPVAAPSIPSLAGRTSGAVAGMVAEPAEIQGDAPRTPDPMGSIADENTASLAATDYAIAPPDEHMQRDGSSMETDSPGHTASPLSPTASAESGAPPAGSDDSAANETQDGRHHWVYAALAIFLCSLGFGLWGLWTTVISPQGDAAAFAEQRRNNEKLSQEVSTLRRSDQISREANLDLQRTLAERDEEIAGLRADVAFYERFVGATGQRRGLSVHDLEIRLQNGDAWHFVATLTQNLNRGAVNSGRLTLSVEGTRNDRLERLSWSGLRKQNNAPGLGYSFKYFQQVEGEVMLPKGFKPLRVSVRLVPAGGSAIEQSFAWPDALRKPLGPAAGL